MVFAMSPEGFLRQVRCSARAPEMILGMLPATDQKEKFLSALAMATAKFLHVRGGI